MPNLFQHLRNFFKPNLIFQHQETEGAAETESLTPEESRDKRLEEVGADIHTKLDSLRVIPNAEKGIADQIPFISRAIQELEITEYGEFIENKEKIQDHFKLYLHALNTEYFNIDNEETYLKKVGMEKFIGDYKELADAFIVTGESQTMEHINLIFQNEKDPKAIKVKLKEMITTITAKYKEVSGGDGSIGFDNLRKLESESAHIDDLAYLLFTEKYDQLEEGLKKMGLMNPEKWKEIVEKTTESLTEQAKDNGREDQFIQAVKEVTGTNEEIDFDDAEDLLEEKMEAYGATGASGLKETLTVFKSLTNAVSFNVNNIKNFDVPDSIKGMVFRERCMLINGTTNPPNMNDKIVVEFANAPREKREAMLETQRDELFKALANIRVHYEGYYKEQEIHEDITKLVSNKRNPDEPTRHDIIARIMAIRTFASESEWLIKGMDKDLGEEMLAFEEEETPPKQNFNFDYALKPHRIGYVSVASRNGFNGKELGKVGLTALAWLTLIANVAKGNWASPITAAAGGTIIALKHPKLLSAVGKPPAVVETAWVETGLDSLNKKWNRTEIANFVISEGKDEGEFGIMKKIDPLDVQGMLREAEQRATEEKGKPEIRKEDLANLLGEEVVNKANLKESNNKIRYDFYKKLVKKGRNVDELQENCNNWLGA